MSPRSKFNLAITVWGLAYFAFMWAFPKYLRFSLTWLLILACAWELLTRNKFVKVGHRKTYVACVLILIFWGTLLMLQVARIKGVR